MKKKKFKVWKLLLIFIVIVILVFFAAIFYHFKNYYISGTVTAVFDHSNLRIELDEKTVYSLVGEPGDELDLYYEDVSKFKVGDKVRAICTSHDIVATDPPIVDAYWIF